MDDSVLRAMARWPDVPAVFGWLSLDRRGRWLLKGEPIANKAALAFVARNYGPDDDRRWFFQNGPQRVFVALEAAPLVLRLEPAGGYSDHRGQAVSGLRAVFMDEHGSVWLDTQAGPGVLDDRDLDVWSDRLCGADGEALNDDALIERVDALRTDAPVELGFREGDTLLPVRFVAFDDAPARLGFVRDPQPD